MSRRPRICFTIPSIYPLFNPRNKTSFGGWEVRIALIAKELARRGKIDVNLVVADHGQPHIEKREGVVLYSWEGRALWGIPTPVKSWNVLLRRRVEQLIHKYLKTSQKPYTGQVGQVGDYPIRTDMISIYDEVDADIYIVPGNSEFSTEVAFYCKQHGKKYVFLAGSDIDYVPEHKTHPEKRDLYGVSYYSKAYAIESAAAHLVQNEHQASLLRTGYGRTGTVIKNPIDLNQKFPRNTATKTILWVGKSNETVKRPSLILELARQLPQISFVVFMLRGHEELHKKCLAEAQKLSNVTLFEYVPFEQIESYFASAYLHVNTSTFEGFPNTFLQAAKYGVPTVSLKVDPGGMLSQYHCGVACKDDFEVFKQTIQSLMTDTQLYEKYSRQSLDYLKKHHDKDIIIPKYEEVLLELYKNQENLHLNPTGNS